MSGAASLLPYFFHHFPNNERMTAREEHWADAGRKGKPNVVGSLPGRGGGMILTRTTMKTPMAMMAMKTMTSFLDTTTNLWLDAFMSGRGDGAIFMVGNVQ